ncbi:uncharacterized protein WM294_004347 [Sarcoramphus papa]
MHLAKLAKSLMRVALLKKAPPSGTSKPAAWLLGLARTVSLGTKPSVASHMAEQGGSLGLPCGRTCKIREAVMLLRWPFKAIKPPAPKKTAWKLLHRFLGTVPEIGTDTASAQDIHD